MFKKQCSKCEKKIDRKFNFCPWCGYPVRAIQEREDFGFLGKDDSSPIHVEQKLPLGLNGIMNQLIKQMEKELGNLNGSEGMPRGMQIKISTGKPITNRVESSQMIPVEKAELPKISKQEETRRATLPKVFCKSNVKRLDDKIVYELETPGVTNEKEVSIVELETGLEIRVYTQDKCYIKVIPLTVEVVGFQVVKDKVLVELQA